MTDQSKLDSWVQAGLMTAEQADAIRSFEEERRPVPPARRLPLAAEALGYLGGSLALIAAVILIAQFWPDLETWARLTIAGLAAVLLLGAGAVARTSPEPALQRLTGFLWLLSAGGVAFFAGLVADEGLRGQVIRIRVERIVLSVGLVSSLYSAVLWSIRRSALQQIALAAGLVTTVVGVMLLPTPRPFDFIGFAIWGLGVIWLLLSWGELVRPVAVGYGIGSLIALGGAQVFSLPSLRGWGLALGVATAAALLAASALARTQVLLGFGAAGMFLFVPQGVFHWFGDTLGAPVALLLAGIALMVLAFVLVRLRGRVAAAPPMQGASP